MSNLTASIEGLGSEKYWGAFWLVLGVILLFVDPPGALVIVAATMLGGIVAAIRVQLFAAGRLVLGARMVLIEAAILLVAIFTLPKSQMPASAWGYLGVGAVASGVTKLITGLCEGRINRALTTRFFGSHRIFAEPARVEPEVAWRELPSMAPHPVWEEIRQSARPALQLVARDDAAEQDGHAISKLGGRPDLPADFEWPVFHDEPLDFLAQIRLDEVAALDPSLGLPETGLLSFFYSAEQPWGIKESDIYAGRVYFHPLSTATPSVQAKAQGVLPLRFSKFESPGIDRSTQTTLWDLEKGVPEKDRRRYNDLLSSITPEDDRHQLMGHPVLIQNEMHGDLETAARAYALPEDTEWTLLLQLWSEPRLEWCWGDAGALYFWIPTEDLAQQRFDRTWVVLQCT
jgi:hypothetical protein